MKTTAKCTPPLFHSYSTRLSNLLHRPFNSQICQGSCLGRWFYSAGRQGISRHPRLNRCTAPGGVNQPDGITQPLGQILAIQPANSREILPSPAKSSWNSRHTLSGETACTRVLTGGKEIAFSHITSENPPVRLLYILTRVKNLGFHTLQNERSLRPEPTMRYVATQLYDQVMNVLHEECVMVLSTFTQASMLI